MKDGRYLLALGALAASVAAGCSMIPGRLKLEQSGTIVVKPGAPFHLTFFAKWPVGVDVKIDNGGPGTLEVREALPDSTMHTVVASGQPMSFRGEVRHIDWLLTSDDEAVVSYRFVSDGGGSLSIGPK